MLVPTDEKRHTKKKYEELWTKIRDDHDENFINIKFNPDDHLPLNRTLGIRNMTVAIRSVFHEGSKYYSPFLLD